ncbi:MAG: hypothetical protein ACM3IH_06100 [Sphingobacteriales bacterium]
MSVLHRIVHKDHSITIYWRCPACSHVEVNETRADHPEEKGAPNFKSGN